MESNKKITTGILTIIFILITINSVSAFSVGSAYHKNNPLQLSPGESTIISFSLQNMAGDEDITAKANILQGNEFMKIINSSNIYEIPLGGEKIVSVRVTIPPGTRIGETYKAELEFSTITENKKGTFGFGSAVGRKFDIIVASPGDGNLPEEKSRTGILIVLVVLILLATAIIVILKKRKNKRFKNRIRK